MTVNFALLFQPAPRWFHFTDPARQQFGWGGEGIFRKKALDSPEHEISEYHAKFYLRGTNYVTGQVKHQIFDHLSSLAWPGRQLYQVKP